MYIYFQPPHHSRCVRVTTQTQIQIPMVVKMYVPFEFWLEFLPLCMFACMYVCVCLFCLSAARCRVLQCVAVYCSVLL